MRSAKAVFLSAWMACLLAGAAAAEKPVIRLVMNPVENAPGTAPGALILFKGSGFSAETVAAFAPPYPVELGGVRVFVDRLECPLLFVSPDAVLAQLPYGIASQRSSFAIDFVLVNPDGEASVQHRLARLVQAS